MIEVAVVVGFVWVHEFGLGGGVCGANVVGFAKVVPGDDFDVVGLEFQKLHPAVDVDVGILCV